jgi:hypothetical protein
VYHHFRAVLFWSNATTSSMTFMTYTPFGCSGMIFLGLLLRGDRSNSPVRGPHRGHTLHQRGTDSSGHWRSANAAGQQRFSGSNTGRAATPVLSRTEEARGANPLTSTHTSPAHRLGGSHPPGRGHSSPEPDGTSSLRRLLRFLLVDGNAMGSRL